jgi:hypothetical protein
MTTHVCSHLRELVKTQIPAIEASIEKNRYYLGRISGHYIGLDEATDDFNTKHLLPYWGKIFKALYCTYKCPDGNSCEIEKRNHAIAKTFRAEIKEFGIDKILEGGDETEKIFTKFRERTEDS